MKSDTRQRLIDAFYDAMHTKGYQGVVLDEVLAGAKVHKGSMYHFFKSKKELALAAIREKMAKRLENAYLHVLAKEPPYLPHWFATLRDTTLRDFKRGCPIANLVQEMSNLDKDFERTMRQVYIDFRSSFKTVYDKAVEAGELKPCDTDRLALFTLVVLEGAILSVKASGDENDYLDALSMLEASIEPFRNQMGF